MGGFICRECKTPCVVWIEKIEKTFSKRYYCKKCDQSDKDGLEIMWSL